MQLRIVAVTPGEGDWEWADLDLARTPSVYEVMGVMWAHDWCPGTPFIAITRTDGSSWELFYHEGMSREDLESFWPCE